MSCQPPDRDLDAEQQAESAYRAITDTVNQFGGSARSILSETVFLRDGAADIVAIRRGRQRGITASDSDEAQQWAVTEVEQAPQASHARLEVLVQALVPTTPASLKVAAIRATPECSCADCAGLGGLKVNIGVDCRLYAGGIYGPGIDAYEQTKAMFATAEKVLQQADLAFSDVMRTWIYFREMDRDYDQFNRARREFFQTRNIDPIPASTGIGAGLVPPQHDVCLGIYAVKANREKLRTVMTTPTLNEAPVYGSDFSRGMRVAEANKTALYISGTASLDEAGHTVHTDNFEAQAKRMLLNVSALLAGQGADFSDVVSAMTYLKHPEDADRLQTIFQQAGYEGFPNVIVEAPVCRPELLCETELIAILSGDNAVV